MRIRRTIPAAVLALASACARTPAPVIAPAASATSPTAVLAAIGTRIADLKARGGDCQAEAAVLDRALSTGRITLRPYMWREGSNLASARGEASGQLTIARDIDSLNVGVRGLDDVLRSAEHEAVHIASGIPSGTTVGEALIEEQVRACRSQR